MNALRLYGVVDRIAQAGCSKVWGVQVCEYAKVLDLLLAVFFNFYLR